MTNEARTLAFDLIQKYLAKNPHLAKKIARRLAERLVTEQDWEGCTSIGCEWCPIERAVYAADYSEDFQLDLPSCGQFMGDNICLSWYKDLLFGPTEQPEDIP